MFLRLTFLCFFAGFLISDCIAQNNNGGIKLGSNNTINGILNTGNYNRLIQINIENPTPCQLRHIQKLKTMDHRFSMLLASYKKTESVSTYQKMEVLINEMDVELDALPYCDSLGKLEDAYPSFNCPFDYIEKGDKLYNNLSFIDAHIWYSRALICISDPDLKTRVQTKVEASKRKIFQKESFLNTSELSKIDLITLSKTGGVFIKYIKLKGGKFLSLVTGYSNSGYDLGYKLVFHDSLGNIIKETNLDEIDFSTISRRAIEVSIDEHLNIYFLGQYNDSISVLYEFDKNGGA